MKHAFEIWCQGSEWRILVSIVLPAIASVSIASNAVAQGPELLNPTGEYGVGLKSFAWTDESRDEPLTDDPTDKRQVGVEVWYPAEKDPGGRPIPYVPNPDGWARVFGSDAPALMRHVRTHTVEGADVVAGEHTFPVIVFSHGANQSSRFYTTLYEEFASHGYVVAAVSHFGACRGSFPGMGFVSPSPKWSPPGSLRVIEKDAELYEFWDPMIETLSADQRFVLDKLAALNNDDEKLVHRLDLTKVAFAGHSRGCKATFRTCRKDNRCKAALILDDPPPPPERRGLKQPTMIMHPADATVSMRAFTDEFMENTPGEAYRVSIEGIEHMDFADLRLLAPDRFSPRSTSPEQALEIIRSLAVAFFDSTLRSGAREDIKQIAAKFSEVEVKTKSAHR